MTNDRQEYKVQIDKDFFEAPVSRMTGARATRTCRQEAG